MINKRLVVPTFFALILLAFFMPAIAVAGKTQILDVNLGSIERGAGITLVLSEKRESRAFTLEGPDRLVIDVPDAELKCGMPGPTGAVGKLVKNVRHGPREDGVRLVLDLAERVQITGKSFNKHKKNYELAVSFAKAGGKPQAAEPRSYKTGILEGAPDAEAPKAGNSKVIAPPQTEELSLRGKKLYGDDDDAPVPVRRPDEELKGKAKPLIVIDAGHGGVDPGAKGASGNREKDLTLIYAKELKKALLATHRFRVILTREDDTYLKLAERAGVARNNGADLFISLHADSAPDEFVRGLSVYTISGQASDALSAQLAVTENKSDMIAGVDLAGAPQEVAGILIDLAQRENSDKSAQFAKIMVKELGREVKLLVNTHRYAGFAVLKHLDVPSVLVEVGFISNPEDEKLLRSMTHRKSVALGMVRAIERYFQEH